MKKKQRYAGWVTNKDTGKVVFSETHYSSRKERDSQINKEARKAKKEGKNIRVKKSSYYNI